MKKYLILAFLGFFASGCSTSFVTKTIKVITDPPDAVISVVSGVELQEQKYQSPATITVNVPNNPALAARVVLEVRRDSYRPNSIALRNINDGDTINIKLEKILNIAMYRLAYRLIDPLASQDLKYRDKNIAVSITVGEQSFQMRLENLSAYDITILWNQAEYTDVYQQPHRLMHSGIHFQDRNNPIPSQMVQSRSSVQEAVIPINNVYIAQQKKGYSIKPLFSLDSDAAAGLKGKVFNLFIPVEVDRQIIPYNFRIQIIDSRKEAGKS